MTSENPFTQFSSFGSIWAATVGRKCCGMAMARRFEKFQSVDKGNGLRATSVLVPGELLYVVEEPFAYTVSKKSRGAVCERCLRRKDHLLRCSQCKFAKYCDARCQREAWGDHKRECKCFKSSHPRVPTDSVRLVGKIVFKLLKQSSCPSEELYSFSDLQSNMKELSEEMRGGLENLAVVLQLYLKEEIQDFSQLPPGSNILEFFAKVACNSFTISDGEMQEVGVGLYPSMSLLNHSCDPNCEIIFEGQRLLLRTIKEIQISEELTISYIDLMMPTADRQLQLKRQYCFECSCYRCRTQDKDADMLAGDEITTKEVKDSIPKMEELQAQQKWDQILALCRSFINNNISHLPDTNIYQMKMLDYAMDACINLSLWDEALLYASRNLEPYSLYYSGFHSLRAVQIMQVGKLQHLLGKFPEALETLKQAFNIMRVTHGRDHSLMQDLMELLGDTEASMKTL
ncbi:histone-lysine N-methyltransferase SMYD3 [Microcaecilia unicolor]|uniref:[histone H3]-lysine(4) N-trimethyltransferase n=1 Tax=Microcaecilia unicolor TaxID=1415580 RepID=A0A6P7XNV1_9AMPH|nr:histone-lysine N-methyltransferase SMYD3 [Microcaecilia unicolor]